MRKLVFLWIVCFHALSLSGCVSWFAKEHEEERPFRMGVLRFNPEMDKAKVLGTADFSGWVLAGNVLVGAVDRNWVVGMNLTLDKVLWWFRTEEELSSPITVVGSWLMLGLRDGTLNKVEVETGKLVWKVNLDSFPARKVTLNGSTLLAFSAGQQLYALDFNSGTTTWLYDAGFPDGLNMQAQAAPVVVQDAVIIGLASGELQGVNLVSGKLLWKYDPEFIDARFHDVMGQLVVRTDGMLLARYDGLVAKINVEGMDRRVIWKDTIPSVAATAFRNGRFYVGCANGQVYAYEASTGKRLWSVNTGQSLTSITAGDQMIYVSGGDGRINAIKAAGGDLVWHDQISGNVVTDPFLYKEGLYFSTGLKNLYAYKIY